MHQALVLTTLELLERAQQHDLSLIVHVSQGHLVGHKL
jgi:hypothetical protein